MSDTRSPIRGDEAFVALFEESGGGQDLGVDGSDPAVNFDVTQGASEKGLLLISDVQIVCIADSIDEPSEFLGTGAALANGIRWVWLDADGNEALDFLDGEAIKKDADFELIAPAQAVVNGGSNDDELTCHASLFDMFGGPLALKAGEKLRFIVQDDLSGAGVTSIRIIVHGRKDG